jgi:hypothetical protein
MDWGGDHHAPLAAGNSILRKAGPMTKTVDCEALLSAINLGQYRVRKAHINIAPYPLRPWHQS